MASLPSYDSMECPLLEPIPNQRSTMGALSSVMQSTSLGTPEKSNFPIDHDTISLSPTWRHQTSNPDYGPTCKF